MPTQADRRKPMSEMVGRVVDRPVPSSLDEALAVRDAARMRLHWHLARAEAVTAMDIDLGPAFAELIRAIGLAWADWQSARDSVDAVYVVRFGASDGRI